MRRRGILSKPKAERIYRELWSACRETRPDGATLKNWGELCGIYDEHLRSKVRSMENPDGYSPGSLDTKRSRLRHVAHWSELHLDLITPLFVSNELDTLERKGMSRALANHVLKEIKCTFGFALQMGAIKSNPLTAVKQRKAVKKRKEALTHDEVDRLLAQAKHRMHRYYYIWLLTLTLGLRRSELDGLKWSDIDFEHRLIYLRRQNIPQEGIVLFLKDKEERVVAIPDYIIPVLKEMKLKSETDFVIEVKCCLWDSGQQAQVLREFCREIGIKEVTHHQLRATHITLALIDGVPLGIVKENVGHAKLSTTDEYFRSAGINMKGQTDGLRIQVPKDEIGEVIALIAR
jgi:integrase